MQRHGTIRTMASVGVGVLGVAAVAAATFVAVRDTEVNAVDEVQIDYSTVEVQQRDLAFDYEAVGSMEPLDSFDVGSPTGGTVRTTLFPGDTVSAGSIIATVDDQVVVVIDGTVPMYRDLTVGDGGPDVLQLEAALVGFGLDPDANVTVDDEFTAATAAMVQDWQASIGIPETGVARASNLVVLSETMRVAGVDAGIGTQVVEGDSIVTLASVDQRVGAPVSIADATTLAVDDAVALRLPDRTELDGTVQAITVGTDTAIRSVVITFDDPDQVPSLDGVTVDVSWTDVIIEDAPTLPSDVFRRLDSGVYVIDVLTEDGTVSTVQVEPGSVVGGLAEVSGVPSGAAVIRP